MLRAVRRHFDNPIGDPVQEVPVMGDEDERTIVFFQGGFEHFSAHQIQMVRRLIEQEDVRFAKHKLRQRYPGLFTAA